MQLHFFQYFVYKEIAKYEIELEFNNVYFAPCGKLGLKIPRGTSGIIKIISIPLTKFINSNFLNFLYQIKNENLSNIYHQHISFKHDFIFEFLVYVNSIHNNNQITSNSSFAKLRNFIVDKNL